MIQSPFEEVPEIALTFIQIEASVFKSNGFSEHEAVGHLRGTTVSFVLLILQL